MRVQLTRRQWLGGALAAGATWRSFAAATARNRYRVFVGTFTNASGEVIPTDFGTRTGISRGLYSFEFDGATGRAGEITLAAELTNPGNLIAHSNGRVLYACRGQNTRLPNGEHPITALAVEGATLRELNSVGSSGSGPTVGVVDRAGRHLLTTNFASNSIVCFKLNADGSLAGRSAYIGTPFKAPADPSMVNNAPGVRAAAQEVAAGRTKPHAIVLSRSERYAVAAEIETNRCVVLRFDSAAGTLTPHSAATAADGAGPRHLQFHPNGRWLFTSDETRSSITAWTWDERRGLLKAEQQLSSLPAGFAGENHPADVAVHPGGRYVYVTNRTTGTIAGYRIHPRTGQLTRIADSAIGSPASWSMIFDPSGRWALVAAQIGDYVAIYEVNPRTGQLLPTGQRLPVTLPICLRMV